MYIFNNYYLNYINKRNYGINNDEPSYGRNILELLASQSDHMALRLASKFNYPASLDSIITILRSMEFHPKYHYFLVCYSSRILVGSWLCGFLYNPVRTPDSAVDATSSSNSLCYWFYSYSACDCIRYYFSYPVRTLWSRSYRLHRKTRRCWQHHLRQHCHSHVS